MKKIGLLLLGLLTMFSCEQEEMDKLIKSNMEPMQTRVASSITDFYPIPELAGIPVAIINVGNSSKKFLSANSTGDLIYLAEKDDGSLLQRWYIDKGRIKLVGGHSPSSDNMYIMPMQDKDYSVLQNLPFGNPMTINGFQSVTDNYYNIFILLMNNQGGGYLQAKNESGDEVLYKPRAAASNIGHWEIVPVGEFRLVDMKYEKSTTYNDFIKQNDMYVDGAVIQDLPYPAQHIFNITKTRTTKSTFSESKGVTTQSQSSFGFSLGVGETSKVHVGFNGEISNTTTSSESVTFGKETTETLQISQTFTVTVPPHSPCTIEVFWRTFNVSITYVATLEKVNGIAAGKRFRIKGKWDGVTSSNLYYNIIEDGKLLKTSEIPSIGK